MGWTLGGSTTRSYQEARCAGFSGVLRAGCRRIPGHGTGTGLEEAPRAPTGLALHHGDLHIRVRPSEHNTRSRVARRPTGHYTVSRYLPTVVTTKSDLLDAVVTREAPEQGPLEPRAPLRRSPLAPRPRLTWRTKDVIASSHHNLENRDLHKPPSTRCS